MASLKYRDENGVWHKVGLGSTEITADKVKVTDDTATALGLETGASVDTAIAKVGTDKAPAYTYGTDDLTAGTSPLETGKLHFVYE
jgi:hypothetical protein